MPRARRSTSLLTALLLVVASVVLCPCAPAASTTRAHDCCAGEGISALATCCQDTPAAHPDGTSVHAVPPDAPAAQFVHFALAETRLAVEQTAPSPAVFVSPPVLRI
jgi:hypothetical protein